MIVSVYVGKKSGIIEQIKIDNEYNKRLGLPDFCHKYEN